MADSYTERVLQAVVAALDGAGKPTGVTVNRSRRQSASAGRRAGIWTALLLAGVATFGVVVYGIGLARLETFWPIAFPLAFALWSLLLLRR